MKKFLFNIRRNYAAGMILTLALASCADMLDLSPISTVDPNAFFNTESQVMNYVDELYSTSSFPTHGSGDYGTFAIDRETDCMCDFYPGTTFLPGEWKVSQTGGNWYFWNIYKYNWFFAKAGAKWEANAITGNESNIRQYFGEVYFFRAYEYFNKLKEFGDFPIITEPLENKMDQLIAASKRAPRTEVAKFILSDLDKAIEYLPDNLGGRKTRISRYAAYHLKSRVALFEATWMKYFKGTAFVPGTEEWPGRTKDYNKDYQIRDYDALTDSLFQVSMDAAQMVASHFPLVENSHMLPQEASDPENPYMAMFGSPDLSDNPEVIFWREYSRAERIVHSVCEYALFGDKQVGLTRGMVEGFLLTNGMPIYADATLYKGDDYISTVRQNRDERLSLFLKEPGQKNILYNVEVAVTGGETEGYPDVTGADFTKGYSTGYALRKGGSFDGEQYRYSGQNYTGCIIFRSSEAFLNYIEACYEKNGSLDATARDYWQQLRRRAGVSDDLDATIRATDVSREALGDWGAYSAGKLIDPTLYNIRRERRCELMAEGRRMDDLKRWRALDQLIDTPYHIEGFKLWGPMQNWYAPGTFKYNAGAESNVSSPDVSLYVRPHEINPNSLLYKQGGYKWAMAHYLSPIAVQHMLITSDDGSSVETSPIYQNPYWPSQAASGALK